MPQSCDTTKSVVVCNSPIIFLDFDGVVSQYRPPLKGLRRFVPQAVERLERLIQATQAVLVATTTWRKYRSLEELTYFLHATGAPSARFIGSTPTIESPSATHITGVRSEEIEVWMWINGRPERFVILEDEEPMHSLEPFVVRTEVNDFLREHHLERALMLLQEDTNVGTQRQVK